MQIKFANTFPNKLGAVEASSVIGCLERLLEMQQQRLNTPSALFDRALSFVLQRSSVQHKLAGRAGRIPDFVS
jgi:hypothetical protein